MTGLEFYNRVYGLTYFRENFILFAVFVLYPIVTRNLIRNTLGFLPLIMLP